MSTPTSSAQLHTSTRTLPFSSGLALSGRILLAAIFLLSGLSKLANPGGIVGYIASAGLPLPTFGLALAVLVEVGGAALLILGYRTRWTAVMLAAFSVVTAIVFHHQFGDQNQLIHFLKNLAIAGGLLQVAASGAGRFSLDGRRQR